MTPAPPDIPPLPLPAPLPIFVKPGCRYIWQEPEALVARQRLYDNLRRVGMDPEEVVLGRIEHDMDKYFYAFNLVDLNNLL